MKNIISIIKSFFVKWENSTHTTEIKIVNEDNSFYSIPKVKTGYSPLTNDYNYKYKNELLLEKIKKHYYIVDGIMVYLNEHGKEYVKKENIKFMTGFTNHQEYIIK